MIDNGMKLVQQIDALTYNSRQVLNALIRSCIQSGSSNGYTVKRGDTTLTLDRTSIYKLYDFYQRWERAGFDPDSFDSLLDSCDAMWKDASNSVTKAVATHSQICYLKFSENGISTADMDSASIDDLRKWCDKIPSATNRKGVVNSAPIPLNLRTPLYDENLSTKSFSQYETYLFPMEYHTATLLGSAGDDTEHYAGGKSWTFECDDTLNLAAKHILMGNIPDGENITDARSKNYGDSQYTISGGKDSFAFADSAVAFGDSSVAAGVASFAAGTKNLTLGNSSAAFGRNNVLYGAATFAEGTSNYAIGANGVAAGGYSIAGDMVYRFTLSTSSNEYVTSECSTIVNDDGTCSAVNSTSKRVETLYGLTIDRSDIGSFSNLQFNVGDTVAIFAQYRTDPTDNTTYRPTDSNGYVFTTMHAKVTNIIYNNELKQYSIELDTPIPTSENGMSVVVGGYLTRISRSVQLYNTMGALSGNAVTLTPGRNSVALNSYVVAAGESQTVVGASNVIDIDSRFIVGIGDDKIDGTRSNGLAIGRSYGVMSSYSGYIAVSVCDGAGCDIDRSFRNVSKPICTGASLSDLWHGNASTDYSAVRSIVNAYDCGAMLLATQGTTATTHKSVSRIAVSGYGDEIRTLDKKFDVTASIESYSGSVVVSSGPSSYVTATAGVTSFTNYMLGRQDGPLKNSIGNSANGNVGVYAQNNVDIAARNESGTSVLTLDVSGYITARFDHISLFGDTFKSLPTTDDCHSHHVDSIIFAYNANVPQYSGFYHSDKLTCEDVEGDTIYSGSGHVITSSSYVKASADGDYSLYNNVGIIIPDYQERSSSSTSTVYRPMVFMDTDDSRATLCRELAYLSDISDVKTSCASISDQANYPYGESCYKMPLVGFKYTDVVYNGGVTPPTYTVKPDARLYALCPEVSYTNFKNSLEIPYVHDGGNTTHQDVLYVLADDPNGIGGYYGEYVANDGVLPVIRNAYTSSVGDTLNYITHIQFNNDTTSYFQTYVFLGGGRFTYDIYRAAFIGQELKYEDTDNGVEATLKFTQNVPGMARLYVKRKKSGGSWQLATGLQYGIRFSDMSPLNKSYVANPPESAYVFGANKAENQTRNARMSAMQYGGYQFSRFDV